MSDAGKRFLALGRAGMDFYADPPGTRVEEAVRFSTALGGSAANIAAAITRLGGVVALVSAVSNDAVGRYVLNQLRHYGIDAAHVATVSGELRTSLAVVESRNDNCQSVIYRNGAADFQISEAQVQAIAYENFDALIVTGTSLALEPSRSATFLCMTLAAKAGLQIILDVDYRPYSWASAGEAAETCLKAAGLAHIVVGNDDEFAVMAGAGNGVALAQKLAATSADIVVYKMGAGGSKTFRRDKTFDTAIFPVEALKPTGAGDAFMGGFVMGLAAGHDLETAVLRGTAAAAIVVTRVGCAPACPTLAELDHFIHSHSR
jgi:5-dehydro-2-deoxygluconokinase